MSVNLKRRPTYRSKVIFHFFFLTFIFLSSLTAQTFEDNCVHINFENFQNGNSSSEYFEQIISDYGISFELANGSNPVIAQVGEPSEAFFSAFGIDAPEDPSLIGNFFLTDDGVIDGVEYSPLLINFTNPIDSVSGIILDLDSDEEFEILASDENGNELFYQKLVAGEDMTGDGIATSWGFNLDGCEGTIHSLRFEGFRSSGDFGLGLDNFIFCLGGTDLLQDLNVEVTNILCQDNPGTIEIIGDNIDDLFFSIDQGENLTEVPLFENLTLGEYEIIVSDGISCSGILNAEVLAAGPTVIEEIIVTHTSCGLDNGSFQVIATQDEGVIYFLESDAFAFQNQNTFDNLEPGLYRVTVIGPTGCSAAGEVFINPSEDLFVEEAGIMDDACQQMNGSIQLNTTGGTGDLLYSIDGNDFQDSSIFDSLSIGEYFFTIQDDAFCTRFDTVQIGETPAVSIDQIQTTETLCDLPTGTVSFVASGGTGNLSYLLDGNQLNEQPMFESLDVGEFVITAIDELGCSVDSLAIIATPICPIFIPNIFTPADDDNTKFRLYTNPMQEVNILSYEIFDRWGARIFASANFSIYDDGFWWNGNDQGYKYSSGVYVYRIEVEYFDGSQEIFFGDITLAR